MLARTFDASGLNAVANHAAVRPWLLGAGPIDLQPIANDPANYVLQTNGGGFVLIRHEPGIYEVHSMFVPEARRRSIPAMRDGFAYMFERTDADEIVTRVPDGNRAAQALARLAGFRTVFEASASSYMSLTLMDWALARQEHEADGKCFHDRLEAAKIASGSQLPVHDDCVAHNRMVGAAVRMVRAGNAAKAVGHYNKWARMAGYAPIGLISSTPAVLDVVDAVVEVCGNDMEILLCR